MSNAFFQGPLLGNFVATRPNHVTSCLKPSKTNSASMQVKGPAVFRSENDGLRFLSCGWRANHLYNFLGGLDLMNIRASEQRGYCCKLCHNNAWRTIHGYDHYWSLWSLKTPLTAHSEISWCKDIMCHIRNCFEDEMDKYFVNVCFSQCKVVVLESKKLTDTCCSLVQT